VTKFSTIVFTLLLYQGWGWELGLDNVRYRGWELICGLSLGSEGCTSEESFPILCLLLDRPFDFLIRWVD